MKKFVIIFSHHDEIYDATVRDLSFPQARLFQVDYTSGKKTVAIKGLCCIDPVKLKWDCENFKDKELCQTIGNAITMNYKKEYVLLTTQ